MELGNYMAHELIEKIRNREITIQEVIQASFDKIDETDQYIHSFVNYSKKKALEKAKEYDAKLIGG